MKGLDMRILGLALLTVLWCGAASAQVSGGGSVLLLPQSGSITQTSVPCGTTPTTLLAAATATKFIRVSVPSAGSIPVWFNWAGAAAVTSTPSEDIAPGGKVVWMASTGYLPTQAISCIATSATSVTLEYQ